MLIGRSDDPQNPRRVAASKVTVPFGGGSRNPSGPAAARPQHTQAGHTTANRTASEFFSLTPCTQGAVHTHCSVWGWIAEPIWASGRQAATHTGRTHDRKPHRIRILFAHPLHPRGRPHTPYACYTS